MCLFIILSNKLDLNQETCFTILVYSIGFRITLPALKLKWNEETFLQNSNRKPSSTHTQLKRIFSSTHHGAQPAAT